MTIIIKKIDNHWTVNGKSFNELNDKEKNDLVKFIKSYDATHYQPTP